MNIVLKRCDEKLLQNKLKKFQKNRLEITKKFCKKFDVKIIYKKIDFLVVKILFKNKNLLEIQENIKFCYPYNELVQSDADMKKLYNSLILFDKFVLVYSWFAFSEQKILYNIYDFDKNKIWQLTFKNDKKLKSNNNVMNSLELSWLFFKCYSDYLDNFFNFFWIQKDQKNIIRRLDYCVDFQWIEVFELLDYIKNIYKKSKTVNWLTSTDVKMLKENNIDIKNWKQEIYKNFFSTHNDLKIYDKILDILDNYKNRKVDWVNPYQYYLDSDFPITRIELKKKKFNNLTDDSLNWVFNNIEYLFFDYLLRYFEIDLSLYVWVDNSLNWKKIFLAKEEKSKKLFHSITMFLAYAKNIENLTSRENLFKIILKNYPDLEKISALDLMDEFEQYEFLDELFPKK